MFSWTDFIFFKVFIFKPVPGVCGSCIPAHGDTVSTRVNSYIHKLILEFIHWLFTFILESKLLFSCFFLYSKEQQLFSMMQLTRRRGTVLFVHFEPVVLPKQGI